MATIKIITVGTLKEKYLSDSVAEYEKRISGFCKVESINIKEAKLPQDPSDGDVRRALDEEAKQILAAMPDRAFKVAMCVVWQIILLSFLLQQGFLHSVRMQG